MWNVDDTDIMQPFGWNGAPFMYFMWITIIVNRNKKTEK